MKILLIIWIIIQVLFIEIIQKINIKEIIKIKEFCLKKRLGFICQITLKLH